MTRYHEEQVWSDKIRQFSTWGTVLLMCVNMLMLLLVQFVFEPWKRYRLVNSFEGKVRELFVDNQKTLEDLQHLRNDIEKSNKNYDDQLERLKQEQIIKEQQLAEEKEASAEAMRIQQEKNSHLLPDDFSVNSLKSCLMSILTILNPFGSISWAENGSVQISVRDFQFFVYFISSLSVGFGLLLKSFL
ncbi:unnamed protein product [Ambrosiozyma monospora]|uniref:Sensitive to high expression protein 9, mitochondrial n=1 Tax=Ambrosiozyma monospora TaxID=43982 RepID=A0A9W6Z7P8_AMBMO|nr:unnamed protein product [Ambrosiozyma monospora]